MHHIESIIFKHVLSNELTFSQGYATILPCGKPIHNEKFLNPRRIKLANQVAFQGIPGAYSEQAVRQYFGDSANVIPCPTLTDLFEIIQSGKVQYAVLPIENALAGA